MSENKNKIPTTDNTPLEAVESSDSLDDLIIAYNDGYKTVNGKVISDIASVWQELVEWDTLERYDLIVPFNHSHQRNEPNGYRFWYLSREKGNRYYHGQFFEVKHMAAKKRKITKEYRLTASARDFFEKYPCVAENKEIETDNNA